uniref:SHNi-TPR domain-containing protein n=1 Tax=Angiostrongylus cantonensis TaxID=6313 RepID=A0A158PB24_ANGCA
MTGMPEVEDETDESGEDEDYAGEELDNDGSVGDADRLAEGEKEENKKQVDEMLVGNVEELEKANAERNGGNNVKTNFPLIKSQIFLICEALVTVVIAAEVKASTEASELVIEAVSANGSVEITDIRETAGSDVSHEADGAEDDVRNDAEDDASSFQAAWEVLEVARNICDKQEPTKEWELRKADVLSALAECSIEEGNCKQALDDLTSALQIQLLHLPADDRVIANSYFSFARIHKLEKEFVLASEYYKKAKQCLQLRIETIKKSLEICEAEKEGEKTMLQKELADLNGLIPDIELKIQDADDSAATLEKMKNELKSAFMASFPEKTTVNQDTPVNDISNILLWVVFPPSKSEIETACTQEFFCLVGIRDLMFIAVNDSHPLGYRLQFDIHAVHVTKFGLLVERDISSRDTSSTQEQVALYSLSHPLNELLAVIFKPRDSLTEWLFCWQKYRYSIVGAEKDCLLVFDHSNEMHCLLRIRITSEYEVRSAIELLEKRRVEVFSRELQRQPDFDLLLAELCLDHIWAEPSKRDASGEIASKMFLSHNVLLQDFLNFFLGAVGQLRSIRVVRTVGNITTSGTLGFVPCRDAVGIRNGDLTVVLEMDNSIGLYSGQIKCAVAVIPRFTISPSMLLISADNLSFVVQYGSQLTKIKVPSLFDNSLARDVLTAVVDVLPREKAMHLMLDWRVRSRNYGNDLDTAVSERQLHSVLRFLLKQCGVSIGHHDKLPWRKNLNRLLSFGEGILQKRAKKDIRPGNSVSDVTVTIDSTAILNRCSAVTNRSFDTQLLGGLSIFTVENSGRDFAATPYTFADRSFPQPDEMAQIARIRWPRDVRRDNVRAMLDSTKPVLIATQHLDAGTDGEIREAQEQFLLATWTRYLSQAFGRAFFSFRTVLPNPAEALTVPDLCLSARIYPSNLTYDLTLTEISPPTAAGLIYAFGMNGHLPNFNMFHIHEVLASLDKFPSIALLLGMAMSKLGTGDRQVHKMLTTHLPFLMGPTMLNLKIDPLIQTSAVSGLGLLFAQTGHTNVTAKAVAQRGCCPVGLYCFHNNIGKSLRADEEPSIELSAYKLSAGFAIGLICLGLGDEIAEARPPFKQPLPSISDRLRALMIVLYSTMTLVQLILICCHYREKNSEVFNEEGTNVNVHMTAHPATIALGLMYMRTGNLEIARDLELPATISLLEEIRPDVIFVRVVARSLVLWNMIEPTCAWIDKQIPNIIHEYARAVLKFPSNIEINVTDKEQAYWDEVVDKETVAEVYLYAMTAACFVMTLKFSGIVGDMYEDILKILEDRMQFLMHDFNIESIEWPARHIIRAANRSVVNLCADMMLLSMAILNVGRGKVNTIRFARYRRSHDCELSYWSHYLWKYNEEMSVHRSLAMLFLGDGRYGFKKDNLSIALLVISMYPIVAHHVADNRLYHQPLRFLWTHAVEPRLLVPMCRKKNKPIQCDLEIQFKDPSLRACSFSAPTILPPIDELALIELSGAGIEKVRFDLTYEGRKRDLVEILTTGHGRVPITVTESCLDDNELAQQKDWTLRQIFDHRVDRPSGKVVKFAREYERMKMVWIFRFLIESRHPGGAGDLRWQSIDTVPAIRQYLRTLHMEITACPPSLAPFVVNDVKLASCVAKFIGNTPLANRLDIEAQRLEHAAKL